MVPDRNENRKPVVLRSAGTVQTNIHLSTRLLTVTTPATAAGSDVACANAACADAACADAACADAACADAACYSAGLVFFHGNGGVDVASATCIRVGRRTFLATAGHNLDGVARDRDIRIIPPGSSRDSWLPFLARNATRRRPGADDVGWIELDPALAAGAGLRFLDAAELSPGCDVHAHAQFLVHGLPAGLATHGVHARGRIIHLTLLGYRTLASKHRPAEPWRLSLRYDWTGPAGDTRTLRPALPAAHGLSGGGVWTLDGGSPRLVAMVRAWHRRERRLSSVAIARWLDLVRRDFPDLRRTIDRLPGRRTP